jgi:hypothetical protein
MPIIDPQVEEPTRVMLAHAIRGELPELTAAIEFAGGRYRRVLGLFLTAAAYIVVDVSGRWPTDADVREIARFTAGHPASAQLDEDGVYDYLAGAALGFRPLPSALGDDLAAAALPALITGSMLFTFRPKGRRWWDYWRQIWRAYETAEGLDVSVLPALQVRSRMIAEVKTRGTLHG